jgi:hypothetical protein
MWARLQLDSPSRDIQGPANHSLPADGGRDVVLAELLVVQRRSKAQMVECDANTGRLI